MVERKVKRDIEKVKLDFCFGYFDKIRTKLLTNSQIVIRYNWLKYKVRVRSGLEIVVEEERRRRKEERTQGTAEKEEITIWSDCQI